MKSIFPYKLWRLVNDPKLDSAISWAPDGVSFYICEGSLKRLCLGKENHYFFTKQPRSFIRQLHLYGFRKVSKYQFANQFFQRGRPELLKLIKRSYKPSSLQESEVKPEPVPLDQLENLHNSNSNHHQHQRRRHHNHHHHHRINSHPGLESNSSTVGVLALNSHHNNLNNIANSNNNNNNTNNLNSYSQSVVETVNSWFENSLVDISYNYNEDTIFNDIYPNFDDDNNITL